MSRAFPVLLAFALAAIVALPEAANACAGCVSGQTDQTRYAFLWTTGMLSVLPLSMLAGLIWWLRRRSRELALREQQETLRSAALGQRAS